MPSTAAVNSAEAASVPKLHRFLGGFRGYLSKQGKVFKQWRMRYFILEKRLLQCFMDDSLTTLQSEVIIEEGTQIYDVTEDVEGMKHLFYVIGKNSSGAEEVMFLSASSDKEKQDWIEAIIDQIHQGFKKIAQTDLWSEQFYPQLDLFVSYGGNVIVDNGNILRPSSLTSAPEVVLRNGSPDTRYCLVMVDMDSIPLQESQTDRMFLHWAVINFAGNDISTGDQVGGEKKKSNSGSCLRLFLF